MEESWRRKWKVVRKWNVIDWKGILFLFSVFFSTMLTACVFVTRDTVRHPRRFVFGKFVRKPNYSWSEAFVNRGLTVLTWTHYLHVSKGKRNKHHNRTPDLLRKNICILAVHMGQITTAPVSMPNPYRSSVAQLDDIFRLVDNTTVHFPGSALLGYGAASTGNWIPTFRAHYIKTPCSV